MTIETVKKDKITKIITSKNARGMITGITIKIGDNTYLDGVRGIEFVSQEGYGLDATFNDIVIVKFEVAVSRELFCETVQ